MSTIENLLRAYSRFVSIQWDRSLAGPQKVWFVIYEPSQERRLRRRIEEFAIETRNTGHNWHHIDLTNAFANWMAAHEYRDAYFRRPERITPALADFGDHVAHLLREALTAPDVDEDTVVAVSGIASLFGLTRTSSVIEAVNDHIRGRMLVFFPGQRDGSNYRILDARDGWNYHAVPIEATAGDGV